MCGSRGTFRYSRAHEYHRAVIHRVPVRLDEFRAAPTRLCVERQPCIRCGVPLLRNYALAGGQPDKRNADAQKNISKRGAETAGSEVGENTNADMRNSSLKTHY